jgi:hypothetical protein
MPISLHLSMTFSCAFKNFHLVWMVLYLSITVVFSQLLISMLQSSLVRSLSELIVPDIQMNWHKRNNFVGRFERQALRSGLQVDHDSLFADQRNLYNFLLSQAKTSFYRSKIVNAPPAEKWKFCNKLFGRSNSSALPSHVSELSLSNNFNDFFSEKTSKIHNDLQSNPLPYPPYLSDDLPEFSGELLSDFQPVNEERFTFFP